MCHRNCITGVVCLIAFQSGLVAQNVTTQRNDNSRTGVDAAEAILNVSNVNASSFGKLYSLLVDGQIYAQPLYVSNVSIPSGGTHNVVYVATENNSVYAFDANSSTQTAPLWNVNLGTAVLCANLPYCSQDIIPEIGISSTPVIDTSTMTIYVVAMIATTPSSPAFTIHALDATTGKEKFGGPFPVQGSVSGTGSDSVNGTITFNPYYQLQRPALLLANGTIYVAFGSHSDADTWHGWIFGYNARTLAETGVRCLSPDGSFGGAGIWQSGVGPVVDANGNIYLVTGNGDWNATTGGSSYAQSIVKLNPNLVMLDWFTPSNPPDSSLNDDDLSSGGPLLIPGTSLLIAGGKLGEVYVIDTTSMGGYTPTADLIPQEWKATANLMYGGRIYHNSTLYLWPSNDVLRAYSYIAGSVPFNSTPAAQSSVVSGNGYNNSPAISLSANGTQPGTAIIWASYSQSGSADGGDYPALFQAFDASTLTEIWGSELIPSRDYAGSWAKWAPPTIANGKVYLATFDNLVNVYGLLSPFAQTITFTAIPTQTVRASLTLMATASSGLSVSFSSSTTSVCTVSGGTATLLASGTCTITASQSGNATYPAATPVLQSFTVTSAPQTITFTSIATQTQDTSITLAATASSGLSVSFASSTTGICTVSGAIATMLDAGTCTITASQAGNATYSAATTVSRSFTVNQASVTTAPVNVSLSSAFNVYGIFNNGTAPANGGLDNDGYAYSENLLGTSVTWSGVSFKLGQSGSPSAVSGGTIALPAGNYPTLRLLASGVNGNQTSQTFVVTYIDGTTSTFVQSISDWFTPANYAGESVAVTMTYRVTPQRTFQNGPFRLYGYSFVLNTAKTVKSITLPNNRNVVVLAMAL